VVLIFFTVEIKFKLSVLLKIWLLWWLEDSILEQVDKFLCLNLDSIELIALEFAIFDVLLDEDVIRSFTDIGNKNELKENAIEFRLVLASSLVSIDELDIYLNKFLKKLKNWKILKINY
jgi:hypothetical protein